MQIHRIEFTDLEKKTSGNTKAILEHLAPEMGKVYVVSISRDGCPACEEQRPKMEKLAEETEQKYGDRIVFSRIHVNYSSENSAESLRSKDVLSHYFYPTNLVLLRTVDKGSIEYYRSVATSMSELRRNIGIASKVSTSLKESLKEQKK
jgi:thiol-disulfide isomerase/thioredoxin